MIKFHLIGLPGLFLIAFSSLGYNFTGNEDKDKARVVVRQVIQSAIDRSTEKTADSHTLVRLPLLVIDEEREKVRKLGDNAVDVIAEYAANDRSTGLQQMAAIQLLTSFHSDKALGVFVQFIEHSRPRAYALGKICSFPIAKTRTIYEKYASDPDPQVREEVRYCLSSGVR
jgi:hypothetical protein